MVILQIDSSEDFVHVLRAHHVGIEVAYQLIFEELEHSEFRPGIHEPLCDELYLCILRRLQKITWSEYHVELLSFILQGPDCTCMERASI